MGRVMKRRFKKGAASFYVVAFSTLILIIIATSFAAVIISEVTRTMNDDLAQSAYDSALAGVEDAKLAYYNYMKCVSEGAVASGSKPTGGGAVTCAEIVWWMEHPDCDMVAHILGRIGKDDETEVMVKETIEGDNEMQQAYTCVKVGNELMDYRGSLSEDDTMRVVRVQLDEESANNIKSVKVSWYSGTDGGNYAFTNFESVSESGGKVNFPLATSSKVAAPPTVSVGIVQTGQSFGISDFDKVESGKTDRGTVYLVPTDKAGLAQRSESEAKANDKEGNYIGAYNGTENVVTASQIVKTNDRTVKNLPFVVYCPTNRGDEFTCSATLQLPSPIGGTERNKDTFMVVLSLPYGQPNTDFALEFCTDTKCETQAVENEDGTVSVNTNAAELRGMQVRIDSTGRANDLYRRVETRLDTSDTHFPYPLYAIEVLGDDGSGLIQKNFAVTCENNFGIDSGFTPNC